MFKFLLPLSFLSLSRSFASWVTSWRVFLAFDGLSTASIFDIFFAALGDCCCIKFGFFGGCYCTRGLRVPLTVYSPGLSGSSPKRLRSYGCRTTSKPPARSSFLTSSSSLSVLSNGLFMSLAEYLYVYGIVWLMKSLSNRLFRITWEVCFFRARWLSADFVNCGLLS